MEVKVKYRINDLNKKLTIQEVQNVIVIDEIGMEKIEREWVKIKDIWGRVDIISNTLITTHNIIENKSNYIIVIRKFTNIDKNMRFLYKDLILYIKNIDNSDKNYLKLTCEETN